MKAQFLVPVLVISSVLAVAGNASAQTAPFRDNYIGAGVSVGVTDNNQSGGDQATGGFVQGRVAIPTTPLSVRGAATFSDGNTVLTPTVTYDLGVAPNTNLYVGGGYSFVTNEGNSSPLGNNSSFLVTAGAETAVARNVVVFGDAKWTPDGYRNSGDGAVSLQIGAGYRF